MRANSRSNGRRTGMPRNPLTPPIAAGSTMRAAVAALRRLDSGRIVIAVPTGSASSVEHVAAIADEVCCANLRRGPSFAVADAYEHWHDLSEDEVAAILS